MTADHTDAMPESNGEPVDPSAQIFESLAAQLSATGPVPGEPDTGHIADLDVADLDAADNVVAALEAILLVAEEPVAPGLLAQLLEIAAADVESLCARLANDYAEQGRGFTIVRVAGGYRYQTHPDQSSYVERFLLEGRSSRLSSAALETLAIVAYKQPISRAQVAAIRGVNVDGVMRSLHQRGYIAEVGRDGGPGNAALYGTTSQFLERVGLDDLDELPGLGEFVPDTEIVETLEHALRAPDEPSPGA